MPRASAVLPVSPARPLRQQLHTQVHLHVAVAHLTPARPAHPATTATRALQPHVVIANYTRMHLERRSLHRHTVQHARERVRHEFVTTREWLPPRLLDAIAAPAPVHPRVTNSAFMMPARRRSPTPSIHSGMEPRTRLAYVTPARTLHESIRAPAESGPTTLLGRALTAPALVWPKPPAADSAPDDPPARVVSSEARAVVAPPGVPRPGALAAAAAPTNTQVQEIAREARRALALDPAFTERLADDVLRKVDKRLRIERERRGL